MDKEKAYKLFKEVLDAYCESEMMVIHERSVSDEDEEQLKKDYKEYDEEMRKHLDI